VTFWPYPEPKWGEFVTDYPGQPAQPAR
jgi:hypothetical protein